MFLSAISSPSPSTYANDRFTQPGKRLSASPFSTTSLSSALTPSMRRRARKETHSSSRAISSLAMRAAAPRPTQSGCGSVPERSPRSCPPPDICGVTRTRGRRRTYSAPTPFGPYSLCAETDSRSMFIALTSMGSLPTICAASQWKKTLLARHSAPISAMGCTTPISLLTPMTETSAVSGVMAASSSSMSTRPLLCTPRYVTLKPCCSSTRHESSTHLCSVCVVITWFLRAL
mmetsp:Transcript_161373/g.391873  ORF Transcript_161373/g.391873 Transcript_161373/m.391873 type:complete len:232 (+) Transcript_161373:321-1016(+)